MSHPAGISARWQRTISRKRRRAAKRFLDADPEAALRQFIGAKEHSEVGTRAALSGAVDRIKFTASHQPRLARKRQPLFARIAPHRQAPSAERAANGRLIGGKPMTSLFAARCQHFAAAFRLHTRAEPVGLGAAAAPRLIRTLWQSNPPLYYAVARWSVSRAMRTALLAVCAADFEFLSVLEPG